MLVYHYTHLQAGASIIQDEFLKVSETESKKGLKPALWFSKNELYEPTALKNYTYKGIINSFKTLQEQADVIGCARIGYYDNDNNLTSWKEYRNLSGLPRQDRRLIEKSYKKQGAKLSDWFCSFEDMSIDDMGFVEIWIDKWVEWTEKSLKTAMDKAEGIIYDEE
tara:strand:+ start:149 stop:643 length:495 start_codon:yes stop_codon:yes gene_type:complete